jgi:GNAT superfamily N-acetyltransferase
MNAHQQLRRGTRADADAAAGVYLRARHAAVPQIPPLAHPDDEVREWMHRVLDEQEAWLAVADDGTLLGLMVVGGDWIEQLYMDPAWTGRGLGSHFVALAKQRSPGGLQLWTFVSNVGAQRFYERHGFSVEERTDGSGNEENAPDLRYVWRPLNAARLGVPGSHACAPQRTRGDGSGHTPIAANEDVRRSKAHARPTVARAPIVVGPCPEWENAGMKPPARQDMPTYRELM